MFQKVGRLVPASVIAAVFAFAWMIPAGARQAPPPVPAPPSPPLPAFADPGISPDGSEIAFVSGGDIWTVPASGGESRLLVSHPATESLPAYSPSGDELAFVSTRTGNGDVYVLSLRSGDVRRLTFDDGADALDGWSRDGRWVYFCPPAAMSPE